MKTWEWGVLVFTALIIVGFLAYMLFFSRRPAPVSQLLTDPQPSKEGYAVSVDNGVYLRGWVWSWSKDKLRLRVNDRQVAVNLPDKVNLVCAPETITDAQGKIVMTQQAYVDVSKYESQASLTAVASQAVAQKIPFGRPLAVIAAVTKSRFQETLQAETIIGFGCSY